MEQNDNLSKWINNESNLSDGIEGKETFEKIKEYTDQLEAPEYDKSKVFNAIKSAQQKESKGGKRNYAIRIAAVLVVILGSLIFFALNGVNSLQTSYAQSMSVELPDSSEVSVFPGTTLEFNDFTWRFSRNVQLDGEAFFKVAKGETFTVKTKFGDVKVLGTQFSVKAIDGNLSVVCYEGKVNVSSSGHTEIISANEYVLFNNDAFVEKQEIRLNALPSEASYYKVINESFADVIQDIRRYYNVEIEIKNVKTQKSFTGNIPKENLEQAFEIISKTFKLDYESISENSFIFVEDAEK